VFTLTTEDVMTIGYVTPAGANIFADLGFDTEEAESLFVRADLMIAITCMIRERKWTNKHAARVLGVSRERVSELKRGTMDAFTIDSLVAMLACAGKRVKVTVVNIADEPAGYALQGPAEFEPGLET
jgi:predicted XRE-type DNA-binding protein